MVLPDESRLWQELQVASWDRAHAWRTPVLATVDAQGLPEARTVVLRSADFATRWLVFFTDVRSPKAVQLLARPAACLVFWCPQLQWQLRVRVDVRIETMGPRVEAAWQKMSASGAAREYLSPLAPGSPLASTPAPGAPLGRPPASLPGGATHFSVLRAGVTSMDWLGLSPKGEHRRVRFEGGRFEPLTP